MTKFRKKPVVIEAVQWKDTEQSYDDISGFIGYRPVFDGRRIVIETLEGNHLASVEDWIIRGVKGEFYPCKPDIFEQTYEPG